MTCKLNEKFEKAVDAVRDALHAAIDAESFDRNALNELTRHYQGLQTIARDNVKKHDEVPSISFDLDRQLYGNPWSISTSDADGIGPDGCYNPDYNISLGDLGNLSVNDDVITFNTDNLAAGTVTVPEHEDDEKIVL